MLFDKIKKALFNGKFTEDESVHTPIEGVYSNDAYTNGKIFLLIKHNLLQHAKTQEEQIVWRCLLDWWGNRQNFIFPDMKMKIKRYVILRLQDVEPGTVTYKHLSIIFNELNRR